MEAAGRERVSDSVEALLRQDHSEPSSRSLLHTPTHTHTRRHTQVWKDQLPPQSRALLCRTTASLPARGRVLAKEASVWERAIWSLLSVTPLELCLCGVLITLMGGRDRVWAECDLGHIQSVYSMLHTSTWIILSPQLCGVGDIVIAVVAVILLPMSAMLTDPLIPGTWLHALYSLPDWMSAHSGCVYITACISLGFTEFSAFLGILELRVVELGCDLGQAWFLCLWFLT